MVALGQTWNNNAETCDGAESDLSWTAALTGAGSSTLAGYDDWRVPNLKELVSIVEMRCYSPSINATVFPGTPASLFWSASVYADDPGNAWCVGFGFGDDLINGKGNSGRVRLLRGGQLFDSFDSAKSIPKSRRVICGPMF